MTTPRPVAWSVIQEVEDVASFVAAVRELDVTPHVPQKDTARPRPEPNRALAALCPKDAATLGDTNALRWQKELIRTALNALPIPASK
jgi:hypothetical protein